jgi:hypothetical protein
MVFASRYQFVPAYCQSFGTSRKMQVFVVLSGNESIFVKRANTETSMEYLHETSFDELKSPGGLGLGNFYDRSHRYI